MTTLIVYDPPMCCSTGICGTEIDQRLVDFAADLDWLKRQGVSVRRISHSQEPAEFTADEAINELMQATGGDDLPALVVDGTLVSRARYPSRQELAAWTDVKEPVQDITEQVRELIAIGASIGASCEPCLKYHVKASRKLGLSDDQMREAVSIGRMVKDASAKNMMGLAEKMIPHNKREPEPETSPVVSEQACCGGSKEK